MDDCRGAWQFSGDNNPFGWRVSAAVIGTLSVALIAEVGWLLFRSMTVATIAALLAAVDGLMLVESRLALLDIFQMFWILATLGAEYEPLSVETASLSNAKPGRFNRQWFVLST